MSLFPTFDRLSRPVKALVLAVFGTAFGLAGTSYLNSSKRQHPDGPRERIEAIAGQLMQADRVGDSAMATRLFAPTTTILTTLDNDSGTARPGARRNCKLAALQLVQGLDAVAQGGQWVDRSRYDAAISDCQ